MKKIGEAFENEEGKMFLKRNPPKHSFRRMDRSEIRSKERREGISLSSDVWIDEVSGAVYGQDHDGNWFAQLGDNRVECPMIEARDEAKKLAEKYGSPGSATGEFFDNLLIDLKGLEYKNMESSSDKHGDEGECSFVVERDIERIDQEAKKVKVKVTYKWEFDSTPYKPSKPRTLLKIDGLHWSKHKKYNQVAPWSIKDLVLGAITEMGLP